MPTLTLKNIPDTLLARLRRVASQQRRSVTQQALYLIEGGLADGRPELTEHQLAAQVAAWRQVAGQWESDQTVQDEINDIYAARTGGRDVEL